MGIHRLGPWKPALRAWQRDAFGVWDARRPQDALIVATPGAGKTRLASRVAHALLADRAVGRILVVVPREHLKAQVAKATASAGIVLDHRFENATGELAPDVHGAVVTYQQCSVAPGIFRTIVRDAEGGGRGVAVVLDEAHHAGDDASWGKALRHAFEPASHRLLMSGTPFRSDGTPIPFVRYDRGGTCVADYAYDYADALRDGVCRALVFTLHGGEAEWTSRDGVAHRATFDDPVRAARLASERLRTALLSEAWLGDVLATAHLRLESVRASGHADAAGLVVAMSQDHARTIAALMERRLGVTPEIVVSDVEGASRRIARFANGTAPWLVAVHMVSEGVDIPRLRVGVFASNVVSELYFRQFCGRFVRTIDGVADPEAYVFIPDDVRLRALAQRITVDVRIGLRARDERIAEDAVALARAQRDERAGEGGLFAAIAARAGDATAIDLGPLFNPAALAASGPDAAADPAPAEPLNPTTAGERKEKLRRSLHGLVSRVSVRFGVEHRKIHATLNGRFGGTVATASERELDLRRRVAELWLARDRYDGLR